MSSCSSFALNILIQSTGIISLNPVKNALKAEEGREGKEKKRENEEEDGNGIKKKNGKERCE